MEITSHTHAGRAGASPEYEGVEIPTNLNSARRLILRKINNVIVARIGYRDIDTTRCLNQIVTEISADGYIRVAQLDGVGALCWWLRRWWCYRFRCGHAATTTASGQCQAKE